MSRDKFTQNPKDQPDLNNVTLSLFSSDCNPAKNKTVEMTVAVPWDQLAEILTSRNWSPAVYENKARNLANYRGHPHLFAGDIDEGMTLDEAKEAFKDYQCIIYTSRNHQKVKSPGTPNEKPACDRFRVVLKLSEPITSDDDFKATWDAYKDKYPLDKQTRSSSMFFFKGQEIIFNNPLGKPLQIVKHKEWQEAKAESYTFNKDEQNPQRGKISATSRDFLEKGAPSGIFNLRLFKCAVDHLEQRYTQEEFLVICYKSAAAGAFLFLDQNDIATVKSAFNREPKYGARVSGMSHIDAQKKDIADRIMDGEFIQCIQPDATLWYRITDYENKEVEQVANDQILERHISTEIKKPENHYNGFRKIEGVMIPVTKQLEVKEVLELWRLDGNAMTNLPEPILWRGVDGWCHRRMNFDLSSGQPHPSWDEFLNRLSDPEVFKAWVYSCFVPEHETRQAMWLWGKTGEDGKTKVINLIAEQFGSAAASITGSQIAADSRFVLSQFLGKRLVVYPDCMKTHFPKTELFRNLTGGDHVTMEFKGGGFIHGPIKVKMLIGSNFQPDMSNANYDRSRILLVDVAENSRKDDPKWPARLREELPAFLGDCRESYQKLCPNNGKIDIPTSMKSRLDDIAETSQEEFQLIFDEHFRLFEGGAVGPKGENLDPWVSAKQLHDVLALSGYRGYELNKRINQFMQFLENKYSVRKRRKADQKFYYFGLIFKAALTGKNDGYPY